MDLHLKERMCSLWIDLDGVFEKIEKLKLMLKYSKPHPIYITSKQDNNCFLQNRMEFEAERTAA